VVEGSNELADPRINRFDLGTPEQATSDPEVAVVRHVVDERAVPVEEDRVRQAC
jgi:hypothetical protein